MADSTPSLTKAYVGLGANLGDPVNAVIKARAALYLAPMVVTARSSAIYASSPVGYAEQADFINCVLELTVSGPCRPLFTFMQALETQLGRIRDPQNQNAARMIDIDLLLFGEQIVDQADLIVPHPRMHERLFVLLPLQELDQGLAKQHYSDNDADYIGQELYRLAL